MSGITFGAMVDPLRKQLEGSGIDAGTMNHLQRDVDAIVRLHIRGLLTDSEMKKACTRFVKKVNGAIQKVIEKK